MLIFEELIPLGGSVLDPPDPTHRQAVRLIADPREYEERLDGTTVLEIRWGLDDALPFALNIARQGSDPAALCRANIVLADHGRTLDYAFAKTAEKAVVAASLHADLAQRDALSPATVSGDAPYRPGLADAPLTRAVPYAPELARTLSAKATLAQSARDALPAITLNGGGETWNARADLLLTVSAPNSWWKASIRAAPPSASVTGASASRRGRIRCCCRACASARGRMAMSARAPSGMSSRSIRG